MGKKTTDPTPGDVAPVKRQRGKQSYLSRLAPFIGELLAYAEEKYKAARFDQSVSDTDLESRDKLRKVLADFPVVKG